MSLLGYRSTDDRMSRGVSQLISTLVRYPEITTVKYEPRHQTIRFTLLVTGEYSEEEQDSVRRALLETLDVYHLLEQRRSTVLEIQQEGFGLMTSVAVTRDVQSFTPEEVFTICEFVRDRFSGRLVVEGMELSGEDEWTVQDEMIEAILADLEEGRTGRNLIAIREDGRVMVFEK